MPIHLKRTKISTILMNGGKVRYYERDINKTNPNTNNNAIHTIQSSWERNLNLMYVKNEVLTRQRKKHCFIPVCLEGTRFPMAKILTQTISLVLLHERDYTTHGTEYHIGKTKKNVCFACKWTRILAYRIAVEWFKDWHCRIFKHKTSCCVEECEDIP